VLSKVTIVVGAGQEKILNTVVVSAGALNGQDKMISMLILMLTFTVVVWFQFVRRRIGYNGSAATEVRAASEARANENLMV